MSSIYLELCYALGFYNEAFSKSDILQTKATSVCLQSISNLKK